MTTAPKPTALPKGILKSDTAHKAPHYAAGQAVWDRWRKANRLVEPRQLTLYETDRFGWVITTLYIGSGARRGYADRSYGINLKGELCRVGRGPHVKQTVTVYLRESRMKDLQPFLDLYNKGLVSANNTRDSISTRRAQTAMRRGAGFQGW